MAKPQPEILDFAQLAIRRHDAAAAMLAALQQAKALTYEGADRLHNMTMAEKARFLAASLVAIATVTSAAIAQAKRAGITS